MKVNGYNIVTKQITEDGFTHVKAWIKGDENGPEWTALKMGEGDWVACAFGIERDGATANEALRAVIEETM